RISDVSVMETQPVEIIEWDDFTLDPGLWQVKRGNSPLELEPKAVRGLSFLIHHRERGVAKEELMAAGWADTVGTENAVTRVIAQIRKQLGDSARTPRYVETAATVGYRFIGEVRTAARAGGAVAVEAPSRWMRPKLPETAAVALVATVVAAWLVFPFLWNRPVQLESLRPLTTTSATEFWPSFSPDSSHVAFTSNRNGASE